MDRTEQMGMVVILFILLCLLTSKGAKANKHETTESPEEKLIVKRQRNNNEAATLALMEPYWKEETNFHENRIFVFYRKTINAELIDEIALKCDQSRLEYPLGGLTFIKCRFEMNMEVFIRSFKSKVKLIWCIFDGYFDDEEFDSPVFPFNDFLELLKFFPNEAIPRIVLERTTLSKDQFLKILDKIEETTDMRGDFYDDSVEKRTLAFCYDSGFFLPLDDETIQRRLWYMSQTQPWEFFHDDKNDPYMEVQYKTKDGEYEHHHYFRNPTEMQRFFDDGYFIKMSSPKYIRWGMFGFQLYASYFQAMGFLDSQMSFDRSAHSFEKFQKRFKNFIEEDCSGKGDPIHHTSYTDGEGDDVQLAFVKKKTRLDDHSYPK